MDAECFISVVLITLLSIAQELSLASELRPIMETDKGRVQGIRIKANDKIVDAFFGIPYAKPPVGKLRFKHPEQLDRWEGVRDATVNNISCMQGYDNTMGNFSGAQQWNPPANCTEDCLYLNVWVPRTNPPFENKAVMVWIYGGGFYSGTVSLGVYDGKYLAAENDVIVVSMNYRLGALGFLVLDTAEARGNAGLMDQRLALEWVQRNIGYFGGNPHNVTIFGESAGAVSVGLHLLSSLSRGLFQRAILQSGAPQAKWATFTAQEGRARSRRLAHALRCDKSLNDAETVECLRRLPAEIFHENEFLAVSGIVQFPFLPVIDGVFLTESPLQYLKSGRFKKTPLLLGSNSNEGSWFLVYDFLYEEAPHFSKDHASLIKEDDMDEIMLKLFAHYPQYQTPPVGINSFGLEAITFHYTDWDNPKDEGSRRDHVSMAVGDYNIVCEVNALADHYAQSGQRVYKYWFDRRSSVCPWPEWMGALHGHEIHFVFGAPLNPALGYSEEDKQLSRKIMRFWSNFAKTGDPNRGPGEISMQEWPRYRLHERKYLNLSVDMLRTGWQSGHRGARAQQCAFWHRYLPKLIAGTSDITAMEKEWKVEFHEWKTRYIVDWQNQFENFLRNSEKRLKTCGVP